VEQAVAIRSGERSVGSSHQASSSEPSLPTRRSVDANADKRRTKSKSDDVTDHAKESREQTSRRRSKKKAKSKSSLVAVLSGVGVVFVLLAITAFVWPGFLVGTSNNTKTKGSPSRSVERPESARMAEVKGSPRIKEPVNAAPQEPGPGKSDEPALPPKGNAARGAVSASLSIRDIMVKLSRGPQALGSRIGKELMNDPPAWESLQTQTAEYSALASSMAAHDPPKGSKDSWTRLTAAFAESAVALERSVESKDRDAALVAHKALENSCMACHQQHRGGPGGPGGFGPKGFGPKGGKGFKKGPPQEQS
jgi:hypothetical protein